MNAHPSMKENGKRLSINPELRRLTTHYAKTARNKPLPLLFAFDPEALHWLFGCFYSVKVLDGGLDYRFEHCGSCWKTFYGFDPTAKRLSEIEETETMKSKRAEFDAVVAVKLPQYAIGSLVWSNGVSVRFDRLTIPFVDEAGRVQMLLVAAQSGEPANAMTRHNILGRPQVVFEDTIWPSLTDPQWFSPPAKD